jgi:hypothetical protein
LCRYARNIKPRSAKRLVAVMPRRGLSAVDGVEGLPRGGKQRAQIFTPKNARSLGCFLRDKKKM